MGKINIGKMRYIVSFLVVLSAAVLVGGACSWMPGAKKLGAKPPDGLFPKQMGKFTLSDEAKQSDYEAPDAKSRIYYANYKNVEGNNVECTVTVYNDPSPTPSTGNSSTSPRYEEVFKSGGIYIGHDVPIERMNATVRGERITYSARTDSVSAIKDFVESLPYDVIKAAPPQSLNLVVTPPEFDRKISDKAETETEKSGREDVMTSIKIFCKSKNLTCSPRSSKTDKSTLLVNASGKTGSDVDKQSDAMVKELKQKSGNALKELGFRQIAVSLSIEKL